MKNLNYDNFELKYFIDKKLGYDLINGNSNQYEIKLLYELEELDALRMVKAFFSSNPFEKDELLSAIQFADVTIVQTTSKQTGLLEYVITVNGGEESVYTDFFEAVKTMDLLDQLLKGGFSVSSSGIQNTARRAVNNSITVYLKELKTKTMSYAEFEATYQGDEYDLMSQKVIKAELTGDSVFTPSTLQLSNPCTITIGQYEQQQLSQDTISVSKRLCYKSQRNPGYYFDQLGASVSLSPSYITWEEIKQMFNLNYIRDEQNNNALYHPTCDNQTVLNNYKNQLILTITE